MSSRSFRWLPGHLTALGLLAFALMGCSAKKYHKSADTETYRILQQVEGKIFGHTNSFTIDTGYSERAPKDIPPAEILAERNGSNTIIINLDKALDLAVHNSREYQTEKEKLYLVALDLTGARHEFSPIFFASSDAKDIGLTEGGNIPNRDPTAPKERFYNRAAVNSQVGVSQLLKTGGSLSLALGNDLIRYFTGNGVGGHDSTVNWLTVNLTQPLLRGFGKNDPRVEALTQAERNVVYAVRAYSRYQQQFAVDTVNAYFDLVTQKDQIRNNYRNYTNKVETTRYLEARAVDRERRSSVDDARNSELGARTTYINSLANYLSALDRFKLRLGVPVSTVLYLDDRDLEELVAAGLAPVEVDRQAAFQISVAKQMDILNAIDRFEDSKRKIRIAADRLRTDLKLVGDVRVATQNDPPNADYTRFNLNNVQYNGGLELDLPLDRLNERNSYRETLINFESQIRSLSLTLDDYRDRIEAGLRQVEQNRLNYINGLESLKVAERRLENNVMLLEAGRATIRDVREAQDSLVQSQNDLSTMYADYLRARLQLLVNIGVIDTSPAKFWLQDPLKGILTADQLSTPPLRMPDDQVVPPEKFLEPVL